MIRIQPKTYINSDYIKDYYYYTKPQAIKMYLSEFKHLTRKELKVK